MEALLRAGLPVDFAAVISNRPDARGLSIARDLGVDTVVIDHTRYPDRASFDAALAEEIDRRGAHLICLAGFMRVLSDGFVHRYQGRLLNIHPALLPAFPGLNTHARALAAGVKLHGATVHFVTPQVDSGPIVVQAAVPVHDDDTAETLAARVLAQEHRIYPLAVRWFAEGRLRLTGEGRVQVAAARYPDTPLITPQG